ncbi:hypothetical protein TRIP_C60052 [Candidatus Zixiibacteriota bacterium]|nr:hypothetical protein TRIP_C60052 [candidate division Zixibacteria bacterium]
MLLGFWSILIAKRYNRFGVLDATLCEVSGPGGSAIYDWDVVLSTSSVFSTYINKAVDHYT